MFRTINPATEDPLREYTLHSASEVQQRLKQAEQGWEGWRRMAVAQRGTYLRTLARLLRERQEELAQLMTTEMGKPIKQARAEVEKCAWCCDFYAEHAAQLLQPRIVPTDATRSFVRFDPIGAVLAIMPSSSSAELPRRLSPGNSALWERSSRDSKRNSC